MNVGFSTATTSVFGQEQTPVLHLFSANNNAFGRALCMTFRLAFLVNPTAHCTDLLDVCGEKATRNMRFRQEAAAAHFAHQV